VGDVTIRPARGADYDDVVTLYEEFHAFHVLGVPNRLRVAASVTDPALLTGEHARIRAQLAEVLEVTSAAFLLAEAVSARSWGWRRCTCGATRPAQ
jgi:hypothetical protein